MTKTTSKPSGTTKPKSRTVLVYGLDDHNKPRAAQFVSVDPDVVAKAAAAVDLEICEVSTKSLKQAAALLPVGGLDPNGLSAVPYIEASLYRKLFDALALIGQPKGDLGKTDALDPAGLPETWEQIAPGHLVVAQESHEYGWAEAVVLEREGETLKLRFRDYPKLPKFTRHVGAVALLNTAAVQSDVNQDTPSPPE